MVVTRRGERLNETSLYVVGVHRASERVDQMNEALNDNLIGRARTRCRIPRVLEIYGGVEHETAKGQDLE